MKQFVTVPNEMAIDDELSLLDLLVYATIKKFMNKDTMSCYPSIRKIIQLSGVGQKQVTKSIQKLEELNYISVNKESYKRTVYVFNPHKNFEIFSYDFLENKELTPMEKAFQIKLQHAQFKTGNRSYILVSDTQGAKDMNLPRQTYVDIMKSLTNKGYVENGIYTSSDGIISNAKIFKLDKFQQLVVTELMEHKQEIERNRIQTQSNTDDIETLKKELAELKSLLKKNTIVI